MSIDPKRNQIKVLKCNDVIEESSVRFPPLFPILNSRSETTFQHSSSLSSSMAKINQSSLKEKNYQQIKQGSIIFSLLENSTQD